MSEQEQLITRLEALMNDLAPNLDDQLNAALALVRAIRAKRFKIAQDIQSHLEHHAVYQEGELKL